jgi:hypothetical protein
LRPCRVLKYTVMPLKSLVPALLAATAWAQQPAADPVEAEKALRERVQQFYQLQVDKKFRQAEAYVAEDTKDLFYASPKPDISGLSIVKVVMLDNATRAEVTVKAKVNIFIMGSGMTALDSPTTGSWKIEEGQWVWYVDRTASRQTPFGEVKPGASGAAPASAPDISARIKNFDMAAVLSQVTVDRQSVNLTADQREQAATITNSLSGPVDLTLLANRIPGVSVKLEQRHLNAGEKTRVVFTRESEGEAQGIVRVDVSPINASLQVRVSSK